MRGIEIKEVSKGYKDTKALDHVSVQFEDGKIYALLGRKWSREIHHAQYYQ